MAERSAFASCAPSGYNSTDDTYTNNNINTNTNTSINSDTKSSTNKNNKDYNRDGNEGGADGGCDGKPTLLRSESGWSQISARRVSTASLFGFMVPRNFCSVIRWSIFVCVSSITTIMSNRVLFHRYKFPVLTAQLIQAVGVISLSAVFGLVAKHLLPKKDEVAIWPMFSIRWRTAVALIGLAASFIPRILFTNLAVATTQISTYQVTRQCAILFSCLLSGIILKYRPSRLVVLSIFMIVAGVVVVKFDPQSLSVESLMWGLVAAFSGALYNVVAKHYLPVVNDSAAVLLNYNCSISIPFLIPLIFAFGEVKTLRTFFPADGSGTCTPLQLAAMLFVSIVMGFFINFTSTMLIKVSSPVTYEVMGSFKNCIQTLFGIVFFNETTSWENLLGITLSVVGGLVYGKAKHIEHVDNVRLKAVEHRKLSIANRKNMMAAADQPNCQKIESLV